MPVNICFPFVGDTFGGSHISTLLLLQNLPPDQFKPIIVLHRRGVFSEHLDNCGLPYELLPLRRSVGESTSTLGHVKDIAASAPRLARFIAKRGIKLVHGNDGRICQTWSFGARLGRAHFIWHQRTSYAPSRLTLAAMNTASRLVCISRFSRDGLPAGPRDRASIVRNPFDTQRQALDRATARTELNSQFLAEPDSAIIGFFGNFTAQKKPEVFIRALSKLHKYAPDLKFTALLFGETRKDWRQVIEAEAELGDIADWVRVIGFVSPPEPFMAGCDILLAPAINEAFGRTLVEAMLVGTPVIASASGGHLEIIEHGRTGILFAPDDHAALAFQTLRILNNPVEAENIARAAQRHAIAAYGIEKHVGAMSDIFYGLLNKAENHGKS